MPGFNDDPVVTGKKKFGLVGFITNEIRFESGKSYSVAGVLDRNAALKEFNGKRLVGMGEQPSCTHVIVMVRAKDKEGQEYVMWRDMTTLAKDGKHPNAKWITLQKSLKATFGADYVKVVQPAPTLKSVTWLPLGFEEVPIKYYNQDGSEGDTTCWKITNWYENEAQMREAEKAHFASLGFSSNGGGAAQFPADVIEAMQNLMAAFTGKSGVNLEKVKAAMPQNETLAPFAAKADELIAAAKA